MDINKEIRNYLTKRRESAINAFLKVNNPHPLLMEIFSELREIDEKAVQNTFTDELKKNCKEYWTAAEEGFNPEEKMQVLLFEYYYPHGINPEAWAYGIMGDGFRIAPIPYDFGNDYDFISNMYASNGVTLMTFSPLVKLGDEIPPQYKDHDFYQEEGYDDLVDAFVFTTYLIFHDAFIEFVNSEEFKLVSREKILHVLIGEHDVGSHQPVYYVYDNIEEIKKAIKEQGDIEAYSLDFKFLVDSIIEDGNAEYIEEILNGLKSMIDDESFKSWAAKTLSYIYEQGFGVEIDTESAIKYMKISVE